MGKDHPPPEPRKWVNSKWHVPCGCGRWKYEKAAACGHCTAKANTAKARLAG